MVSATPTPIKPGLWRNAQGWELQVIDRISEVCGYLVMPRDLWHGVVKVGKLGPTRWLVTTESLHQCGYEFIEEEI